MKNYGLKAKLFLMAGILISFTLLVGGIGFWSSKAISDANNKIEEVSFPNTTDILEMNLVYRLARIELFNVVSPGTSEEEQKKSINKITESWASFYKMADKYKSKPFQPNEEELFKEFIARADVVKADYGKALALLEQPLKADSPEREKVFKILTVDMRPHGLDYRAAVDKLKEYQKVSAEMYAKQAEAAEKLSFKLIVAGICGAMFIGFLFAYLLSNSLVRTFASLSENLYSSSHEVSEASKQIASASQELSQATTEQAASLEETSASTEEMSSMVAKNSDNARSAASISAQSQASAEKGKQVVEQMIRSMDDINLSNNNIMEQINRSNSEIEGIVRVIQEIGTKTKVINEIVFQTKLLSFNASVEAARAGENGKGFAVVAEEVGNLAQMSGNAAKEITELLDGSIQKVEAIVRDTKTKVEHLVSDGRSKVEVGTEVAKQCGEVLNEIVTNVASVTQMAGEISLASQEQASGVKEITKAMGQLDQVTQQNAATSEQSANAAEKLAIQADALKSTVDLLVTTVQGSKNSKFEPQAVKVPQPKSVVKPTVPTSNPKVASNVIPMTKAVKKENNKVISQKINKPDLQAEHIVATADGTIPSNGHPGFKDV